MATGYYTGDLESTRLLPKSQMILERDVLIAQGYGQQRIFIAIDENQARVLWRASALCGGDRIRGGVVAVPVPAPSPQYGPGPDDGYQQGYPQQQRRPQQRPLNQDDK